MARSLSGQGHPLAVVDNQREILRPGGKFRPFEDSVRRAFPDGRLTRLGVTTLQVNVGKLCNQTCRHCHVDAGPDRREVMSRATLEACLRVLAGSRIPCVDLTGGAPEMNPHFRWFVAEARALGRKVMDRCNLTILRAPGFTDLPDFLAGHHVEVVASLPYFQAGRTDAQRGDGVFDASIEAIRLLNDRGYGRPDSGLTLNLVFNPSGAFLPGRQAALEADFRRELRARHGVEFNALFALTNLPISRFLDYLLTSGQYEAYMTRLVNAFNPTAAESVMCRTTLSVGWDGRLYDCDFNQMLELPLAAGPARTVHDVNPADLVGTEVATGLHCYGCTAGAGSSCGGEVVRIDT